MPRMRLRLPFAILTHISSESCDDCTCPRRRNALVWFFKCGGEGFLYDTPYNFRCWSKDGIEFTVRFFVIRFDEDSREGGCKEAEHDTWCGEEDSGKDYSRTEGKDSNAECSRRWDSHGS